MGLRVVLRAAFDVYSGYGNDAVDMAVFMDRAGVDVLPWPTLMRPGVPERFAKMLMRDPRGEKDVLLAFGPPDTLRPWEFTNLAPKTVGWTMWERLPYRVADVMQDQYWLDTDPGTTAPYWARAHQKRMFAGLDELIVTCPMNVEAFRAVDEEVPITVLPNGIDPDKWTPVRRDPSRPMTFLMIGMLNGRKNPFALLEAWRDVKKMKPEFDARLHLHTLAPGLHPTIADGAYGPDITITARPLSPEQVHGLYLDCDVLVSTSRGEGNNKPAMEFMASGGTVLAPRWGGHENWMHKDVTYEIPYTLEESQVTGAVDAAVDHAGLMDGLIECWENRSEVSQKGWAAASFIRTSLGWPVVVERLIKRLEAVRYG